MSPTNSSVDPNENGGESRLTEPTAPMETIGVRELRGTVAATLRRAKAGERIIVTADGQPVAQLGPITPDTAGITLWDLAGAGLIEPPRRHDRPGPPTPLPVPADVRADRLLESVRGRR